MRPGSNYGARLEPAVGQDESTFCLQCWRICALVVCAELHKQDGHISENFTLELDEAPDEVVPYVRPWIDGR